MSEKCYEPTAPPPPIVEADPRGTLTEAERNLYKAVLEHFSSDTYVIPGLENGELTDAEKFWLSRECLLRCVTWPAVIPRSWTCIESGSQLSACRQVENCSRCYTKIGSDIEMET